MRRLYPCAMLVLSTACRSPHSGNLSAVFSGFFGKSQTIQGVSNSAVRRVFRCSAIVSVLSSMSL